MRVVGYSMDLVKILEIYMCMLYKGGDCMSNRDIKFEFYCWGFFGFLVILVIGGIRLF